METIKARGVGGGGVGDGQDAAGGEVGGEVEPVGGRKVRGGLEDIGAVGGDGKITDRFTGFR